MITDHTSTPAVAANRLASFSALFVVAVGVLVLLGWAFDIAVLKSILPGWVSMKANTAACFILIGIALRLTTSLPTSLNPQHAFRLTRLIRAFCSLAGLIGLLTLCEYVFGWNPGFDQWLFVESAGTVGTSNPGRMAPETALCFVLLAVALWLCSTSRKTRQGVILLAGVSLFVAELALAAMLSYATPILGAYGWFGLTIMAMHTAILFTLLGVSILGICWRSDLLAWTFGRKGTAVFLSCVALLVIIGLTTSRAQFQLKESALQIAYSEQMTGNIYGLTLAVLATQSHTRGYVITGDDRFRANYLAAKADSYAKLELLRQLVADNPHQQRMFAQIEVPAITMFQWFQQVIDARQSNMDADKLSTMVLHGDDLLKILTVAAEQIDMSHFQRIAHLQLVASDVSNASYLVIIIGTLSSLLIFLVAMFRLNVLENTRKAAEAELAQHRDHLEEEVHARTIELAAARDAAEAANRAKSVFLTTMSHELRTPLNGVMGMTDLVLRRATDPQQIDWLNKSQTAAKHLLSVLNDILNLSRIEAGQLKIEEQDFSLAQAINDTLEMQGAAAKAKGLSLSCEIDAELPARLLGDALHLKQILINYLGNAVKFSERGQITVRAHALEQDKLGVLLKIEVTDMGIGISPEQISRLFQPFTQVIESGDALTRSYGGSGLGLVISKRIALLMGGDAGVESTPGVGSTFWATVRLRKKTAKAMETQPIVSGEAEAVIRTRYLGHLILVVDDEPINLEVVKLNLEAAGLAVDTAKDGAEAVAYAEKTPYAAIFMDMQMPKMNGLDSTRKIRQLPGYQDIPIIAMTASAYAEDKALCLGAGMNDFLVKPFSSDMLFTTLLRALSRRDG